MKEASLVNLQSEAVQFGQWENFLSFSHSNGEERQMSPTISKTEPLWEWNKMDNAKKSWFCWCLVSRDCCYYFLGWLLDFLVLLLFLGEPTPLRQCFKATPVWCPREHVVIEIKRRASHQILSAITHCMVSY